MLKFDESETKSKIKNIRDLYRTINVCDKGYSLSTNKVKNKNVYLFADSHNILVRWGTISLRYAAYVGLVRLERKIHTAEPLVPEPSAVKF